MLTTSAPLASTTIDHPNKSYSSHHHQIANLHCQPSACSTIALPHQHHQEDHRSSTLHPKFAPLLWATAPKSQTTKLTTKLLSSSIIIEVAKFHHSRGCEIPQLRQPLTANGSKFVTYEIPSTHHPCAWPLLWAFIEFCSTDEVLIFVTSLSPNFGLIYNFEIYKYYDVKDLKLICKTCNNRSYY